MFGYFKDCFKKTDNTPQRFCPYCHKDLSQIPSINKNLGINTKDESKFEILNINPVFDNKTVILNNNNIPKKQFISHENNIYYDKNKFQEMKTMPNTNINDISNQEIEKRIQQLEEREKALTKTKEELEQQIEILEEKNKLLKEKETKLNKQEKILNQKKRKFEEEIVNSKKNKDQENSLNQFEESLKDKEKLLNENLLSLQKKEDLFNNQLMNFNLEKQNFEKEKELFHLSKLPNEIGLQNIGATCYMNATLQSLSNTNKFTEYFLSKFKFQQNDPTKKMSNQMYKVLSNLWTDTKKKGDYPPYDFKNALSEENPLFAGIQANDSKDLINFLLERFHQELNIAPKNVNIPDENVNQMDEMQTFNAFYKDYFTKNKSIITDCFYGLIETRSRCGGCNITKFNFQISSFLEFPLKEVNTFMFQNGRRFALVNNDGSNPDINLYECFDYYQKVDLMTGQNQMYCNICNANRDTYYGTTIYSLPNYLIINLNRGKGAVYSCKVLFPEILNLLNYVTIKGGNTVMQLYAVICHYGPSSMSGHFIAYCRHRVNNKWYKYNDSIVTECTQPNEYLNGMPYILFYKSIEL